MTAFDNIAFPLRQRKVRRREIADRVKSALDLVHLGDFGKRYPRQLSGGQQQRVALARAIVFNPRVLLMDEPLGSLDKKLREWLQLEIKRIHEEVGVTIIYVTHDQDEALVLSDRIAVVNSGRIEQVGAADDLYERPESLFVAEFLGESNVFRGKVRGDFDVATLECTGSSLRAPASPRVPTGSTGVMVVRPERLHVRENGASALSDENVLTGLVRRVIYLGSSRKLEVEFPGDCVSTVREQAGALSAARPGDRVDIVWAVADSILLPEQEVYVGGEGEEI
jgi:putative spermidine/putrescine transport system ATP-binding protein